MYIKTVEENKLYTGGRYQNKNPQVNNNSCKSLNKLHCNYNFVADDKKRTKLLLLVTKKAQPLLFCTV